MIAKLICWLWSHKTVVLAPISPAVFMDSSIFKTEVVTYVAKPSSQHDVNLALLPPGMSLANAFYFAPQVNVYQRLPFCIRCGSDVDERPNPFAALAVESK